MKTLFNEVELSLDSKKMIRMLLQQKTFYHETPDTREVSGSHHSLSQCIGGNCLPLICATVHLIAPETSNVVENHYKSLKKPVEHLKEISDLVLNFIRLNLSSDTVVFLSKDSSANASGMKIQLVFFVVKMDSQKRAKVVHYGSSRCHRISWFGIKVETQALVYFFEHPYMVQEMLDGIVRQWDSACGFLDSPMIFNVIAKVSLTAGRWLLIDFFVLKDSYRRGHIIQIGWIRGNKNERDVFTGELITRRPTI